MEGIQKVDLEALTALIGQLSELNNMLSDEQADVSTDMSILKRPFLFGFDINREESGKDYGRYLAYMEILRTVLKEFGIRIGNNGYAYTMDAVKIIIDRRNYDIRMKSDVFPLIAAKYHVKNFAAIEHSIRNAINTAYQEQLRVPGCNKMGMFKSRPTCKKFLVFIAETVEQSMCENLMRTAC